MRAQRPESALVTGGASGVGRAIVELLADRGVRVVVADVDEDAGDRLATAVGGRFVATDVRAPDDMERAVEAASGLGRLAYVNLGAGVARPGPDALAVDDATFDLLWQTNVRGVWNGVRAAAPALRAACDADGPGRIVVTASLAGVATWPDDPLYTATKHAAVGLVRALAPALERRGVTLSAICPGFVNTGLIPAQYRTGQFPLLSAATVARLALAAHEPGGLYVLQPGVEPIAYRPRGVPGARDAEGRVARPPRIEGT
ncbi:SDR family oxidoreductase [Xylanimonas ulmi]|uniref:NADP-dependent 3-hydroxy acid dehydrogenase YdfG n=1 Tax=Xylanimonas ulmi TaxID=228973 RepID=A0A4Q7M1R8_9MICO|nr:SDR family oxidoreductase [Xylanibacterium ulmi]RZS61364.1 NADP-dependent 3-hydroxy acid dehydrogenase YdfG [Xylanibacterium ulmi]